MAGDVAGDAVTVSELLDRARSQLRRRTFYRLGSGGDDPRGLLAGGSDGACDCSGFLCWCLGITRQTNDPAFKRFNGWVFSTSVYQNARFDEGGLFRRCDPKPGAVVVFPHHGEAAGHCGIVTETADGKMTRVIDCSAASSRNRGDAITEHGPEAFLRHTDTITCWYVGVEEGATT